MLGPWHALGKPIRQIATDTSGAATNMASTPRVALLTFIDLLASVCAVVLAVILMLRFPPILTAVGIACLLFHWELKRLPKIG